MLTSVEYEVTVIVKDVNGNTIVKTGRVLVGTRRWNLLQSDSVIGLMKLFAKQRCVKKPGWFS